MEDFSKRISVPQSPLLQIIFDALKQRGWRIENGVYIDPDGNRCLSLEQAIHHQSLREIAES